MKFIQRIQKAVFEFANPIEKRSRFVISTAVVTGLFILSTFFLFDVWWVFVPLFILVTFTMTYFSVLEGVEKNEWITLFVMPIMFSVAVYVFFFLFPVRWITRISFIVAFALSFYAILLTSNIFNVGVQKSLQLYRAAFSVNYFYQTMLIFILSNVVASFKFNMLIVGTLLFLFIFVLANQLLWTVRLQLRWDRSLILYSAIIGLFIFEIALTFTFVPIKPSIFALLIASCYYSLSGLIYHHVDQKLFPQTIREYVFVVGFVFCIALLTLQL
ncbi:hypothetical protein HGB07_04315 [Candidatus Roizmanbacteria bacterium]|nr:hypothetical protein [Candidatus Roizmanbacteria bacterium]